MENIIEKSKRKLSVENDDGRNERTGEEGSSNYVEYMELHLQHYTYDPYLEEEEEKEEEKEEKEEEDDTDLKSMSSDTETWDGGDVFKCARTSDPSYSPPALLEEEEGGGGGGGEDPDVKPMMSDTETWYCGPVFSDEIETERRYSEIVRDTEPTLRPLSLRYELRNPFDAAAGWGNRYGAEGFLIWDHVTSKPVRIFKNSQLDDSQFVNENETNIRKEMEDFRVIAWGRNLDWNREGQDARKYDDYQRLFLLELEFPFLRCVHDQHIYSTYESDKEYIQYFDELYLKLKGLAITDIWKAGPYAEKLSYMKYQAIEQNLAFVGLEECVRKVALDVYFEQRTKIFSILWKEVIKRKREWCPVLNEYKMDSFKLRESKHLKYSRDYSLLRTKLEHILNIAGGIDESIPDDDACILIEKAIAKEIEYYRYRESYIDYVQMKMAIVKEMGIPVPPPIIGRSRKVNVKRVPVPFSGKSKTNPFMISKIFEDELF